MNYSVQPKDRTFVKGYGFLSFAKNVGKNMSKNFLIILNNLLQMHSELLLTEIEKAAETTGDVIGNKIADKIKNLKDFPTE